MTETLSRLIDNAGYELYEKSVREIGNGASVFVVKRREKKLLGVAQDQRVLDLPDSAGPEGLKLQSGKSVTLHPLTWDNYIRLRKLIPLTPSTCDRNGSFGTGDRLGMVTAAHLRADSNYPVFPIIAQQSPRELERTGRSFKSVLLDAVMGVLESGYTGTFGADADHIKDETRFMEGVEAGFSMYTLDVSDDLQDISGLSDTEIASRAGGISELSRKIVSDYAGKTVAVSGGDDYTFSEDELVKSVLVYEQSMKQAVRFYGMAKTKIEELDLEVSIDEGTRDTTPEDHVFVAEYLHRNNVDFRSLAPKFPGEFQKAIDYKGDYDKLARSFAVHAELARLMNGYRLSMHSGSDKFSVYKMFGEATQGHFHIKTSGTSWLQAAKLIAHANLPLFAELYRICIETLPESKKAYHVDITLADFPAQLPENATEFFAEPNVQQLFHISYGALLDAKRPEIIDTLARNEELLYQFVVEHIDRHLALTCAK